MEQTDHKINEKQKSIKYFKLILTIMLKCGDYKEKQK
jgi:hypothetical protein